MKQHKSIFLIAVLALISIVGQAQTVKLSVDNDSSKMTVVGTSTLHDWESEVTEVKGVIEVGEKMLAKQKIKKGEVIPLVNLVIPVKSIVSPRGATMDKKTYNALKSEENPEITFNLKDSKITSFDGTDFEVSAVGELTIAGVTKPVEFPVAGKIISSDQMSFKGSYKLNMLDYEMEPPSAMFGQIETGEDVEIKFELIAIK